MSSPDPAAAFLRDPLLTSYDEIAASPRLLRDYTVHVLDGAVDDALHAALIAYLHEDAGELGPVMLIEAREPTRRVPPFGGRYLVAPAIRREGEAVFVAPLVMFQMQFDKRLHKFAQRYGTLANQPIESVTRAQIQTHVLNSFSYFRIYAHSPTRPW